MSKIGREVATKSVGTMYSTLIMKPGWGVEKSPERRNRNISAEEWIREPAVSQEDSPAIISAASQQCGEAECYRTRTGEVCSIHQRNEIAQTTAAIVGTVDGDYDRCDIVGREDGLYQHVDELAVVQRI